MGGWSQKTRKRMAADRARKKAAKVQLQHLRTIKTKAQLRAMVLATRVKQK